MCELPSTERSSLLYIHATTTCTSSPTEDVEIRSSNANSRSKSKKSSISVIIFGQVVALALACGNASSAALENQHQIPPTCLTGLVYFVLSFHLVWLWRQRTKQETKIQTSYNFPFTSLKLYTPWYIYLMLSILDVEANYLAMLSFQQTKLSSSMLLTSLSVLSTVLLRKMIFGSNISGKGKLVGVFLCVLGGCLCLQGDVHHSQIDTNRDLSEDSRIYLHGDILALVAAFLYGLNDVLAEYFVKNSDRVEYLGMLGFFGFVFSFCIQAPILEGEAVRELVTTFFSQRKSGMTVSDFYWILFLLSCFVMMLSFFYVAVSLFLSENDATILNLSLQSCPLWAVVLATVGEIFAPGEVHWFPPPIFFVALILVAVGTFAYESEEERNECLEEYEDCCEVTRTSPCGSNRYRIDEFIP